MFYISKPIIITIITIPKLADYLIAVIQRKISPKTAIFKYKLTTLQ